MEQKKNLCAQVPLSLHAQVSEAREAAGQTTSEYITNLLPFQELKADCKFPTIQLSLKKKSPPEMRLKLSNAIKLTNKFQKKEKSLDKGKKMCGKALKTRLIFRGRAHEIHS